MRAMSNEVAKVREKPKILLAEIGSPVVRRRVAVIDRHIKAQPQVFTEALATHQDAILAEGRELSTSGETIRHFGSSPTALLTEYFSNNFDKEVVFDDDTEDAIAADPQHRELLRAVREARTEMVRKSAMATQLRENLQAPGFRDAARVNRLSLYIGQVINYQEEQSQSPLPNTG
jgi:hypothetical protein